MRSCKGIRVDKSHALPVNHMHKNMMYNHIHGCIHEKKCNFRSFTYWVAILMMSMNKMKRIDKYSSSIH